MGNHDHPCEFCGQDQRCVFDCCPEYVESERKKKQSAQDERDRIVAGLKERGLPVTVDYGVPMVSGRAVLAFLEQLELRNPPNMGDPVVLRTELNPVGGDKVVGTVRDVRRSKVRRDVWDVIVDWPEPYGTGELCRPEDLKLWKKPWRPKSINDH